ncbi:MAG: hypothetical protein GY866_12790 [Proteobacteria bacterium]|nr:hypothetical protein [Pseudomonadota bacterium]
MFLQIFYKRKIGYSILLGVLAVFFIMGNSHSLLAAKRRAVSDMEYPIFWSDYRNTFLYQPVLVKKVFWGIIDLKGNERIARKFIDDEVLGCRTGALVKSGCRIDQLRLDRKKKGISKYFNVPVNFTHVSKRRFRKDKRKSLLTLIWNPALIQPPILTVDAFFNYINAASSSKYYKVKKGLELIQLNSVFENKVEIVVDAVIAKNLIDLYCRPPTDIRNRATKRRKRETPFHFNCRPPTDFRDSLTFHLDSSRMGRRLKTADLDLQMKAVKVMINHQVFEIPKDALF